MARSPYRRGSDKEFADSIVAEAVRQAKLAAKNDGNFVPVSDDVSAMLAARTHAVPLTVPPPLPDDTGTMLAARTYARAAVSALLGRVLTFGAHLVGGSYDGSSNVTLTTDATSANTASTIVARDASGNFSGATITAVSGITLGSGAKPSFANTGAAATAGTALLVAGTKTIATTAASASCLVQLQRVTAGGAVGDLTWTRVVGTSITINSASATDVSLVSWHLIEQH